MHAASLVLLSLLAQEASPAPAVDAKAKAQALLKEGAQDYEQAAFADALAKFEQAYALFPSPRLLFNIGQANRELGRPLEAIDAFERFLVQVSEAPLEMFEEAKRSVAELSTQVGKLLIECTVAGAVITVDGEKVGEAPIPDLVRVMPGRHQVTATHPRALPAIEDVVVAVGTVQTVVLRPPSLTGVAPAPAEPEAPPGSEVRRELPPAAPPADEGFGPGRKWTWVAAGSAVVLAGGAAIAGLAMRSKFDELDKKCGSSAGADYSGCSDSDISAVDLRKNTANVLWGLSAAAVVTAGVLFFVEGRPVAVTPIAGNMTGVVASTRY
jgi:hypothetical protein